MEIDIREYLAPLRKWWWMIAVTTFVAAIASFFATRQQVPVYRSYTRLAIGNYLESTDVSNNDFSTTRQLATAYVEIANQPGFSRDAALALGLDALPRDIDIRQVNDTNFVDITVTDTDPVRSMAVAAELARQLSLRTPTGQDSGDQEFVAGLLADYQAKIEDTQDQIATKEEEIGELISARDISVATGELNTLENNLQNLTQRYTELLSLTQEGATNSVQIVDPATEGTLVNSNSIISVITAAGIGFVLSASAAYLLEYLDDTIKTPDQVMKLGNLPTLAGIAHINSDDDSKLITISDPRSPTSEAYRVLRTAIQFSVVDKTNSILLMTSGVPSEGKSTTAGNLAVVLAQAGNNVLVIDGDLRRPSQHNVFKLPNKRGVTSLLLKLNVDDSDIEIRNLVEDTIQPTQVDGLQIMTCGPVPPNPSEMLGSAKMRRLLDVLDKQFDFVIVDSPPVLSVTDAAVLGALAGITLIVVRANKSRKDEFKQVIERLVDVNSHLAGVVLNSLKSGSEGHNFYYYYKDPYYTYGDEPDKDSGEPKSKLRKRFLRGQEAVQS
ncbi:MAG: polysaccharide biosynthesis tyrosine autokinase [Ardenticatenaceae bacterium]|nr:polysaccharide biosynthesis tyrosine autokinase [Anaerolineales bacterium]MCB8940819.1 polysaccharide biosynthesis tyrosine autokinase [Ardenticatenaceae bacterium]MCB8972158.1 polysaccharide biosynthesis tyrosine autokinase [Ardenticatenaceae bacterium]